VTSGWQERVLYYDGLLNQSRDSSRRNRRSRTQRWIGVPWLDGRQATWLPYSRPRRLTCFACAHFRRLRTRPSARNLPPRRNSIVTVVQLGYVHCRRTVAWQRRRHGSGAGHRYGSGRGTTCESSARDGCDRSRGIGLRDWSRPEPAA
jgi:hypothetical protein